MQRNLIDGLLLAMIGGAFLVSATAGAQTYKWTDAEGKVHYSDQPPPANAKDQGTVKSVKPSAPTTSASPPTGEKGTAAGQTENLRGAGGGIQEASGRSGRARSCGQEKSRLKSPKRKRLANRHVRKLETCKQADG